MVHGWLVGSAAVNAAGSGVTGALERRGPRTVAAPVGGYQHQPEVLGGQVVFDEQHPIVIGHGFSFYGGTGLLFIGAGHLNSAGATLGTQLSTARAGGLPFRQSYVMEGSELLSSRGRTCVKR